MLSPHTAKKLILSMVCLIGPVEAGEIWYAQPALDGENVLPLLGQDYGATGTGCVEKETYDFFARETTSSDSESGTGIDLLSGRKFLPDIAASLVIEHLNQEGPAENYRRSLDLGQGVVTTTYRIGRTGFIRRSFYSKDVGLFVIHMRTDMPGALSFRVKLRGGKLLPPRSLMKSDAEHAVRVWVHSMESEVDAGADSLAVHGEGEALVFVALSDAGKSAHLETRLDRYGFSDGAIPDLAAVLIKLEREHLAAHRKAMGKVRDSSSDQVSFAKVLARSKEGHADDAWLIQEFQRYLSSWQGPHDP